MSAVGFIAGTQISSGRAPTHKLAGYLATAIGLVQPIIAYYRPNPKDKDGNPAQARANWCVQGRT
jgi:hypothetical protein